MSGCWLWTAGSNIYGYGAIQAGRRSQHLLRAHRVSWQLHRGPVPVGLLVLHRCDTPACVNPSHLFLGTQPDNIRDKVAKRRHAHGITTKGCKLNPAKVREIRASLESHKSLALLYGVSRVTISNVKTRHTWRYVDG